MLDAATIEQAIDVLKHDLPTLFQKDISYTIYSQNIDFRDPINQFKGKFNYRIVYWTLRFHSRLFFTNIFFDLHEIYPANNNTIRADWTVRGTLRLPWKANIFFNGYSIYTFNSEGLIYQHVDTWDRSPREILQQFFKKSSG